MASLLRRHLALGSTLHHRVTVSAPLSAAFSERVTGFAQLLRGGPQQAAAMGSSAEGPESEVLHQQQEGVGVAVLNRPRALNSLNTNMVELLFDVYDKWNTSSDISCILLKGAGEKAFCAGGDVKTVVQLGKAGKHEEALRFFNSEYRLNYLISRLQRPHVALIDGITMGGGVGVSVHGTFRVATERTLFAMPECAIGLFPDVGGSYFLPRLPGTLGLYLALTGARLKGAEVKHAQIATHYIPSKLLPQLHQSIVNLGPGAADAATLNELLCSFERRELVPADTLRDTWGHVERLFAGRATVEEIHAACEADGSQFAQDTLQLMRKGSPLSQKLTFEQLRRGAELDLGECLKMEMRMVHQCVMKPRSDFYSGVTAALIDRTNSPSWHPPTLEQVTQDMVAEYFQPIPADHELRLPSLPGGGAGGSHARL